MSRLIDWLIDWLIDKICYKMLNVNLWLGYMQYLALLMILNCQRGRPEEEQGKQMLPWILQTLVKVLTFLSQYWQNFQALDFLHTHRCFLVSHRAKFQQLKKLSLFTKFYADAYDPKLGSDWNLRAPRRLFNSNIYNLGQKVIMGYHAFVISMKLFSKIQRTSSVRIESTKSATTLQKLGGPNSATPESRTRNAWDLRTKPESRAKSEKERGRGLGRRLGELLHSKFWEFRTSNRSIWCIVEREILKKKFLPMNRMHGTWRENKLEWSEHYIEDGYKLMGSRGQKWWRIREEKWDWGRYREVCKCDPSSKIQWYSLFNFIHTMYGLIEFWDIK